MAFKLIAHIQSGYPLYTLIYFGISVFLKEKKNRVPSIKAQPGPLDRLSLICVNVNRRIGLCLEVFGKIMFRIKWKFALFRGLAALLFSIRQKKDNFAL